MPISCDLGRSRAISGAHERALREHPMRTNKRVHEHVTPVPCVDTRPEAAADTSGNAPAPWTSNAAETAGLKRCRSDPCPHSPHSSRGPSARSLLQPAAASHAAAHARASSAVMTDSLLPPQTPSPHKLTAPATFAVSIGHVHGGEIVAMLQTMLHPARRTCGCACLRAHAGRRHVQEGAARPVGASSAGCG